MSDAEPFVLSEVDGPEEPADSAARYVERFRQAPEP